MRYIFVFAVAVLALFVLTAVLFVRLRKRYARKKVCSLDREEKRKRLDAALEPFGFYYEEKDDSISSQRYPWQREMGYCRAYDEGAAAMNMVIDCEPIYFNYAGRRYLIELWKGQYGCTTGAEIGVYVNDSGDFRKPADELFYECVEDEESLPLEFVLWKEEKVLLRRNNVHWWLTGFRVGMYSRPEELTLEAGIVFPSPAMCAAFCEGLVRAGYGRREFRVEGRQVCLSFHKPHYGQQHSSLGGGGIYKRWVMWCNRRICRRYCRVTGEFRLTLDRITFLGYCFPFLYRILIRIGVKCSPHKYRRYRRKVHGISR